MIELIKLDKKWHLLNIILVELLLNMRDTFQAVLDIAQ